MTRNRCLALLAFSVAVLLGLTMAGTVWAEAQASGTRTAVVGKLSLAETKWTGSDLTVSMGATVSFMLPGNAGYMVYERADARGAKRLCVAKYGTSGMQFEIMIDVFALETDTYTPLDVLGLSIISAGERAKVLDSRRVDVGGATGLDLTFRGVYVDRQMPKNDARMVMLTDMTDALMFTLVERQPKPEEHREVLDEMVRTVLFASQLARS